MTEDQRNGIVELCYQVLAHAELDLEVNIGHNGCNAFENSPFARKILSILGLEKSDIEDQTYKVVEQLEQELGF